MHWYTHFNNIIYICKSSVSYGKKSSRPVYINSMRSVFLDPCLLGSHARVLAQCRQTQICRYGTQMRVRDPCVTMLFWRFSLSGFTLPQAQQPDRICLGPWEPREEGLREQSRNCPVSRFPALLTLSRLQAHRYTLVG